MPRGWVYTSPIDSAIQTYRSHQRNHALPRGHPVIDILQIVSRLRSVLILASLSLLACEVSIEILALSDSSVPILPRYCAAPRPSRKRVSTVDRAAMVPRLHGTPPNADHAVSAPFRSLAGWYFHRAPHPTANLPTHPPTNNPAPDRYHSGYRVSRVRKIRPMGEWGEICQDTTGCDLRASILEYIRSFHQASRQMSGRPGSLARLRGRCNTPAFRLPGSYGIPTRWYTGYESSLQRGVETWQKREYMVGRIGGDK